MEPGKRLKRGLKDISPLFQETKQSQEEKKFDSLAVEEISKPASIEFLSVFSAHSSKESSLLSLVIASKLKMMGYKPCLFSVEKEYNHYSLLKKGITDIKRFYLTMKQFEEVRRSKLHALQNYESTAFLFDFNYQHPLYFQKVLPILDKIILFVKPEIESLSEVYRWLKMTRANNPDLEYFMIYHGKDDLNKAATLFERFSDMVSKRLGIGLSWLGSYDSENYSSAKEIHLDGLRIFPAHDSLEKRSFTDFVQTQAKAVL